MSLNIFIKFNSLIKPWEEVYTSEIGIDSAELSQYSSLDTVVNSVVNTIIYAGAAATTVAFLGAAILYASSTGDPKKAEKAKNWLTYGFIAAVCLILAVGGQAFVKGVLNV
jgi:ABC-type Fe3+ transport system permease subunit